MGDFGTPNWTYTIVYGVLGHYSPHTTTHLVCNAYTLPISIWPIRLFCIEPKCPLKPDDHFGNSIYRARR